MVKTFGKYEVPYDGEGNLNSYPASAPYVWDPNIRRDVTTGVDPNTWVKNEPFQAEMELITFGRGRSAATFHWKKVDDGRKFPMFMTDMVDLIKFGIVDHGKTPLLWWVIVKRGLNYGLAVYEPKV